MFWNEANEYHAWCWETQPKTCETEHMCYFPLFKSKSWQFVFGKMANENKTIYLRVAFLFTNYSPKVSFNYYVSMVFFVSVMVFMLMFFGTKVSCYDQVAHGEKYINGTFSA